LAKGTVRTIRLPLPVAVHARRTNNQYASRPRLRRYEPTRLITTVSKSKCPPWSVAVGGCREFPKVFPGSFAFVPDACPISLAELPDGNLLTIDRAGTLRETAPAGWPNRGSQRPANG